MKKTVVHYDSVGKDGWRTLCGIEENRDVMTKWKSWRGVTCKNCLKHKPTKRRKK